MVTQFQPAANFDDYVTFSIDPTVAVVDETGSVSQTFTVDGANLVPPSFEHGREELHRGRVEGKRHAGRPPHQDERHARQRGHLLLLPGYCGWYPYYYCYPSWSYEGSYNFGSLVLTMGDVKNAAPGGGKLPLIWTSSARGVLSEYYTPGVPSGGANVNWARIQESIDRAFADSPYIRRTP